MLNNQKPNRFSRRRRRKEWNWMLDTFAYIWMMIIIPVEICFTPFFISHNEVFTIFKWRLGLTLLRLKHFWFLILTLENEMEEEHCWISYSASTEGDVNVFGFILTELINFDVWVHTTRSYCTPIIHFHPSHFVSPKPLFFLHLYNFVAIPRHSDASLQMD